MIIQLHTKDGIFPIDTDSVTDAELIMLNVSRINLNQLIPRDLTKETDELKRLVEALDVRLKVDIGGHIR